MTSAELHAEAVRAATTAANLAYQSSTLLYVCAGPGLLCKHDGAVRAVMGAEDLAYYVMRIVTRQWTWGGQDGDATIIRCPFCGDQEP